jgi:hypothetical protein
MIMAQNAGASNQHKSSNYCSHVQASTCKVCATIPLFPNWENVNRFRIRRLNPGNAAPSEFSECKHYVAVSYSWTTDQDHVNAIEAKPENPYEVVEEDGTVRPMRAPKDVIDRVVRFAAENGIRAIWIDQECIDQNDEQEKELGIQAMDLIYTEAKYVVGVFRAKIEQQALWDALCLVHEVRFVLPEAEEQSKMDIIMRFHKSKLQGMSEAVKMIANDRWNTRAWILQESFAAGPNMILLFPRSKAVDVSDYSLISHHLSMSDIAIQFGALFKVLEAWLSFLPKDRSVMPPEGLDEVYKWIEIGKQIYESGANKANK